MRQANPGSLTVARMTTGVLERLGGRQTVIDDARQLAHTYATSLRGGSRSMTRSSALGLDHAGVLVSDVPRAVAFYCDVLGLQEVPRPTTLKNPGAWLQVGSQQLHLIGEAQPGRGRAMNRPYNDGEIATGYGNHVAL